MSDERLIALAKQACASNRYDSISPHDALNLRALATRAGSKRAASHPLIAYAAGFVASHYDDGTPSAEREVDPDDLAHREQRGANAAVKSEDVMPDVASMNLLATKATAMSIGSYGAGIRKQLGDAVLARLRELGAGQIADAYQRAWDDLLQPSDVEAEQAGAAHGELSEHAAKRRADAANRALFTRPRGGRSKQQALDEDPLVAPQRKSRR